MSKLLISSIYNREQTKRVWEEFRAVCDQYGTKEEIVTALEAQ